MKTISAKQFYELGLKKNEALRDVRIPSDYNIEHIPNAVNRPVKDFDQHKDEAKKYDTIYIYCNTSIDSQIFCKYAEKHNINAININLYLW
jgi:rhodanese-related sulfurtransferase